ncbi:MAG: PilZ domain-containing protein [Nitrospirota bacterium]
MIIRLACPVCRKDSYTASVESFKPCPYCGIVFSGVFGLEKRNEVRQKKEIPFTFSHKGKDLAAKIANLSRRGIGLRISGSTLLSTGDIVDLNIQSFSGKARVMWVLPDSRASAAGLRILEQLKNSFF